MKTQLNLRSVFLILVIVFINSIVLQHLYAQNDKKNIVRLSANYVKVMNQNVLIEIRATSKINKKTSRVSNINLTIYNELEDTSILLSKLTTDIKGETVFKLNNLNLIQPDSSNLYTLKIIFEGNESFKKTSKIINFKDANIEAKLITEGSLNYIVASLIDKTSDFPIESVPLTVQVQRLFRPLILGDELNFTDKNGSILVPIEEGIPGINGVLTFEVILKEHNKYGTIKTLIKAPIGIPITEESTFNERTMWSPRNKTPLFLLIIPNMLTFGIWGIIIYLIINLFKIFKS